MPREKSVSTGLAHGLAVPHGSRGLRARRRCGVWGSLPDGIPFESADGKPARLVILLVIPANSFQQHVGTLAGIARLSRNEELRERVFNAKTTASVLETLYELEAPPET